MFIWQSPLPVAKYIPGKYDDHKQCFKSNKGDFGILSPTAEPDVVDNVE